LQIKTKALHLPLQIYNCCIKPFQNYLKMNKTEFIGAVAEQADLTKVDAKKAVDAAIKTITDALAQGDKVAILGFGTFSVSERSARTGHNPATGKAIEIGAKKVAKFKAGAELAGAIH
jgi:DNA-binding protein HU-beta